MSQKYLDIARQGKNDWWRYLFGTILILFFWLIIGGIIAGIFLVIPFANQGLSPSELALKVENYLRTPSLQAYLIINLQFIFFLLGIFLTMRWLHQRRFLSLVSVDAKIKWQRFFQGFAVWFLIQLILFIISYLLDPNNLELNFKPTQWFLLLAFSIILTPIQTSTEELFFRGYILQGFGLITKQPLILMIVNGVLFMLPHLANPEIQRGFLWMALYYFAFGVFCSLLTIKDNRLELAFGAHAANNLFVILFVTTKDSAIQVPAIWLAKDVGNPQSGLIWFLIKCSLFYLIIFGLKRKKRLEVDLEQKQEINT
ncbi:MAG: CPBP family intramembrane metalloprotease [Rivularia sp. ALOHA_DT_140]|nr:CPBP family intramembrane metalloprotease [Rivularia sp. ALOHA_DT_140]